MKLRQFLPDKPELIFYVLLAVIIVFVGNLGYINAVLVDDLSSDPDSLGQVVDLYASQGLSFVDGLSYTPSLVVMVFWAAAGLLIFQIFETIRKWGKELKRDVDIDLKFEHPEHFDRGKFWRGVAVQFAVRFGVIIATVTWAMLLFSTLAPAAVLSVRGLIRGNTELSYILATLFSLVVLWVGVIVLAVLVRVLLGKKRPAK